MLLVDTAEQAQVVCFHCGEKCDEVLQANGKAFCCAGCQTVYELLRTRDLCGYYDFAERGAFSFKQTRHSRFEFLDDETVRPQLLQFSDGTIAKTTLRLPAIHCASCIWLLENLFKINPAILRSEVNFLKKEIALTFRAQEIKLSEVASLLARLGYEPDIRFDNDTTATQMQEKNMQEIIFKSWAGRFCVRECDVVQLPRLFGHHGNFKHTVQIFIWLAEYRVFYASAALQCFRLFCFRLVRVQATQNFA